MTMSKFRTPAEMKKKEEREPVSARVRTSTKSRLEKEARNEGMSIGEVIGQILDDYIAWLDKAADAKERPKRKRS